MWSSLLVEWKLWKIMACVDYWASRNWNAVHLGIELSCTNSLFFIHKRKYLKIGNPNPFLFACHFIECSLSCSFLSVRFSICSFCDCELDAMCLVHFCYFTATHNWTSLIVHLNLCLWHFFPHRRCSNMQANDISEKRQKKKRYHSVKPDRCAVHRHRLDTDIWK